jgi:hypothetical protein
LVLSLVDPSFALELIRFGGIELESCTYCIQVNLIVKSEFSQCSAQILNRCGGRALTNGSVSGPVMLLEA